MALFVFFVINEMLIIVDLSSNRGFREETQKKFSTICMFVKYTYLCNPKCRKINIIIYGNEKNISTFE